MAPLRSRPRTLVDVLGCPVNIADRTVLTNVIHHHLGAPGQDQTCQHLVTLNPEHVMLARSDPGLQAALRSAQWVTADGIGIVLAAPWLGSVGPSVRRVTGVECMNVIAAEAAVGGHPVFLLGGAPGVAEHAAGRLVAEHSGLQIAGTWDGGTPDPRYDEETLRRIRASRTRILLVAYGAPGQVTCIERMLDDLGHAGVMIAVGVGGAFDFKAGVVRRAPRFFQRLGLEWLFRLVIEPWRWRRQLRLPVFAALVLAGGMRQRLRAGRR